MAKCSMDSHVEKSIRLGPELYQSAAYESMKHCSWAQEWYKMIEPKELFSSSRSIFCLFAHRLHKSRCIALYIVSYSTRSMPNSVPEQENRKPLWRSLRSISIRRGIIALYSCTGPMHEHTYSECIWQKLMPMKGRLYLKFNSN